MNKAVKIKKTAKIIALAAFALIIIIGAFLLGGSKKRTEASHSGAAFVMAGTTYE